MSAAYRVKYRGPKGCRPPDAILTFNAPEECISKLAQLAKERLVAHRGGYWKLYEVTIEEMVYLGPWFVERSIDKTIVDKLKDNKETECEDKTQ